jgi:hypothetical protein
MLGEDVVVAAGDDGAVVSYRGGHARVVAAAGAGVRCLAADCHGGLGLGLVVVGTVDDGAVSIYRYGGADTDADADEEWGLVCRVPGHGGDVNSVAVAAGWLVSGADDGAVRILDYRRVDEEPGPGERHGAAWLQWALEALAEAEEGMGMGCRAVYEAIVGRHPEAAGRGKTPANTLSALLHRESRRTKGTALIQIQAIRNEDEGAGAGAGKATRFILTARGRAMRMAL